MFPMTITLHNQTQLSAVLAAMALDAPVPEVKQEAKPAKEKPKATAQAEAKQPEAPAATAAPAPQAESVAAEVGLPASAAPAALNQSADAPAVTYQETANAITSLAKAKGRAAAMEVLASFGLAKLPDAQPEQFADIIIAAAQKAGA